MICNEILDEIDISNLTRDFSSEYSAPEINETDDGISSYQSDVYSLSKMVSFILAEKQSGTKEIIYNNDAIQNDEFNRTLLQCLKKILKNGHLLKT